MINIAQDDRNAAASVVGFHGRVTGVANQIVAGECDDHPLVQAFARHRLLGHEAGRRDMREAAGWQPIETAPRDRTEFLSVGGTQGRAGQVYPTKWLSPGPYTTENGKNTEGQRRFQYPDGFYWAGYDGFVGPVDPTHWRPFPEALPTEPLGGEG